MTPARILIIAGSDSSGGAGIQADIKTINALGGHPITVITALTAQNTQGIQAIYPIPINFVYTQFQSIINDIGQDAIKIGMLYSTNVIKLIAKLIKNTITPIVLDPIILSSSGDYLIQHVGIENLLKYLVPLSTLITPNLNEAEILLKRPIRKIKDMAQAAYELVNMGAKSALIKGGHLLKQPIDILFDGHNFYEFRSLYINNPNTHGTGCSLASASATLLAQGWSLISAIKKARSLVLKSIATGYPLGYRPGPIHIAPSFK